MPFEYAVRPFQSRDSAGRTILPSTPGGAERASLTWGSTAPGSLPTPHSLGVNTNCCNETITQSGAQASTAGIQIQGPNVGSATIEVKRTDVVVAKRSEKNSCNDWYSTNSYVASGIKEAFSEMASLIHSSDAAFLPSGSTADCGQKTTYKYDGA